jgi:hypothetical protein
MIWGFAFVSDMFIPEGWFVSVGEAADHRGAHTKAVQGHPSWSRDVTVWTIIDPDDNTIFSKFKKS